MEEIEIMGVKAKVAHTFAERARGLIGRPRPADGEGMLIEKCNAIHTFFMKYPIDATFLDREGRVVRVVRDIQPWRLLVWGGFRAAKVLETPSRSPKRFWFFDLDGTLADTDGDIRLAWKAALADMDVECPNFDRDFVAGPPIEEMARRLMPDTYTDEFGEELRRLFGRHYDGDGFPTTREYPGVMERVRALRDAGARVFIATNKRWEGASALAAKFGWMDVFERLYTGDMFKNDPTVGKMRKPQLLAYIMREVGAKPEECVMVGDTSSDFEAAEKNMIESVAVTWGYGKNEELRAATRVASTPQEI